MLAQSTGLAVGDADGAFPDGTGMIGGVEGVPEDGLGLDPEEGGPNGDGTFPDASVDAALEPPEPRCWLA